MTELLDEMQTEAQEMAFEEHSFFREELKENLQTAYAFDSHQQQFEKTQKGIRQGLALLQEIDVLQRQTERLLKEREKHQRETDQAWRRVSELETVLEQVQNEWKEALYRWNGQNQELVLSKEKLKELAQFAQEYNEKSDYASVRQLAADVWLECKGGFDTNIRQNQVKIQGLEAEYEEIKKELLEWENHKEPEPVRSEAVRKNRDRLREKGIPYQEFYKVLEFGHALDKTACDRLEEALLHMGILDALVVEEEYKAKVLAMDTGCCDRYLFVQKQRADKSILDVLDLNDSVNDIFFNQRITGLLENIAYDSEGVTSISPDGVYQIGVLTGTVTGEYEAGFLGTKAREQNRQAKISDCRQQMKVLEEQIVQLRDETAKLERRKQKLAKEYQALPKVEDLREAFRMLEDAQRLAERMKEEGNRLEEQLRNMSEQLRERKTEALKIAEKLYLTCSYEVFRQADQAARMYGQHFYQVKSGHELYLQIVSNLREWKIRMEDLDLDMDQIRYDLRNTEKALKKEKEELRSVQEQLKLTDYEQIKERLNGCMEWLNGYPALLQQCVEERTEKREQIKTIREQMERSKEQIVECQRKAGHLKRCCETEQALEYVELPEELGRDAKTVQEYLAVTCQNLHRENLNNDLNKVFFENRGFLNDYQLVQTELFEDILANTVSRKIRGKINSSNTWVDKMNNLMGAMNTSSGLTLSLRWRSRTAENEDQLDTKELVELLKKDYRLMREEEAAKLSLHFRSKVEEARRHARDSGGMISFYQVMKETLDYRKWFEFQLFSQKSGEKQKELTNSVFGTFSGGEKAMSMYVPLFSAVVAKYQGGRADAPRLISLDEAFAGVDNKNIRDMFRLMTEFQFNFIINSQVLWGDCDTLDALAIYQLLRPENAKFVTVMPYLWNGKSKELLEDEESMEQRAVQYA